MYDYKQDNVRDLRNGPQIHLTTLSAKKSPLDAKDFEIPKDYTRVKSVTDVSFSSKQKNEITDLSDLGFASESKTFKEKNGSQK